MGTALNQKDLKGAKVAYFCAEFGIEGLPFGGGLGILAGDYLKSCADLGLPVVGVGINYNRGNFHQELSPDGWQTERYDGFDPTGRMRYHPNIASVPIEGRQVGVSAWQHNIVGETGYIVPLLLADTNGNNHGRPWDDSICDIPYPSQHPYHRLTQEQVLGLGGFRILEALKYNKVQIYHPNEGHAALLAFPVIEKYGSIEEARKHIVFAIHTPVFAGIDQFLRELAEQVLNGGLPSKEYMKKLTGVEHLNMARLAMAIAGQSFGVSPLHAEVSKFLFSDFPNIQNLNSYDNGVHLPTWASPQVQKLYDRVAPDWRLKPKGLEGILELSEEEVINAHNPSRENLGRFLSESKRVRGNADYNPKKLTIGFSRRAAAYKQATLIFEDPDRLARLGKDMQIIFAMKAHPTDNPGKEEIKKIFRYIKELKDRVSIWFIEDYDMEVAKLLVRGVDLWLNNPQRYQEASGTSGMKAAAGFVPLLSIIDGWSVPQEPAPGYTLPKGLIEGVTGWGIGRMPSRADLEELLGPNGASKRAEDRKIDAASLYDKLEYVVLPLFKNDREAWARVMRAAAAHNVPWFNTHRMAEQYFEKAYNLPLKELVLV